MRVVKTTWEEKKASIATFRDVTERKQMEEALRKALKTSRRLRKMQMTAL